MDTHILLLGVGLIIILSFIFNIVAQKSNVPSVLMLMVLGYILGQFVPMEGAYEEVQTTALSLLGTVGVILIVLEAALDLHLEKDKTGMIVKSLILAAALLVATSGLIAVALKYILEMGWLQAWLYAVPLAVMSSAIIIPSIGSLSSESREFLTFEASFSDILGIILFYALAGAVGEEGQGSMVLGSLTEIGITVVLSFVLTYLLIIAFQAVEGHVKLFFLIGILLALYGAGKLFHLSPLLLILIFGLGLNNKDLFFRGRLAYLIHDETFDHIVKDFSIITLESAFVVRTFFFVVFGMSIELAPLTDIWVWVISGIALVAIYGTRVIGLKLAKRPSLRPEIFIAPRGLITILLFYSMPESMKTESFNTGILVLTILATSFVMSYGLITNGRKGGEEPEADSPAGTAKAEAAPEVTAPTSSES